MNQASLDFQQLRIKHILFKSKVRSVLYGGALDAEFFSASGPVSLWFNQVGLSKYQGIPEMHSLMQLQQSLTLTANTLFNLYRAEKIEEAHQGISEIEKLSEKFAELISALEAKLAS